MSATPQEIGLSRCLCTRCGRPRRSTRTKADPAVAGSRAEANAPTFRVAVGHRTPAARLL